MNNQDLSKFGYRELGLAGESLTALSDAKFQRAADGEIYENSTELHLEFNPNSGYVFLATGDGEVLMLNDGNRVQAWGSCPECNYEDFDSGQFYQESCIMCKQ